MVLLAGENFFRIRAVVWAIYVYLLVGAFYIFYQCGHFEMYAIVGVTHEYANIGSLLFRPL